MERIYCLLIGYLFGCFLTAEFICKKYTGRRVQEDGPDNPGMASIVMRLGVKAGFLVLLGDFLKAFFAITICRFWLFSELSSLAVSYAGLGAVLGHCFPLFWRFRGGKGIAVTGAYSLCLFPPIWLVTYILGGIVAFLSGYLAVGSAAIAVLFPISTFLFGFEKEEIILSAVTGVIILMRHWKNYGMIYSGEERNFHFLQQIKKISKKQ